MRSPSADELWQVGDAMQAYANRQPDYLEQAMEAIRNNSPSHYDFAKQLQQTVQPAFQQSPYAQLLLDKVGPAPTATLGCPAVRTSRDQAAALSRADSELSLARDHTVVWPQITPQFTFPTEPSAFTFPGQPGGEPEGQRALREAQELVNKRAQGYFAQPR